MIQKETGVRNGIKENRIKTIKDLLMRDQLDPNQEIVPNTGHCILHETITMNKRDLFRLALLYNGIEILIFLFS